MRNKQRAANVPRRDVVQCSNNRFFSFIITKMDWIKNNIWQTLIVALITVVFSAVGSLYVYNYTKNTDRVENAASTDYVDKKTGDLKTYIDVQDGEIKTRMNTIDRKFDNKVDKEAFDRLCKQTDDNHDILIQILREVKK